MGAWLCDLHPLCFLPGDNGSKWVKHWVKGGYHYYHNLETQAGGWDEPPDFVQNSVQLSREEIQVGHLSSREKALRERASGLALAQRSNTCSQQSWAQMEAV